MVFEVPAENGSQAVVRPILFVFSVSIGLAMAIISDNLCRSSALRHP
ncbi:MAG: hypothetical protein KDI53_01655 [Candidatus Accumulibacter sp.]|nr:hypothetical protein [Accumulibacter sp.]